MGSHKSTLLANMTIKILLILASLLTGGSGAYKYQILGKYEVQSPASAKTFSSTFANEMECSIFCKEASSECGAFYIKEDICNLVNKDASGNYKNPASLTPSTVDYYILENIY